MKETANRHQSNRPNALSAAQKAQLRGAWKNEQRSYWTAQRVAASAVIILSLAYIVGTL